MAHLRWPVWFAVAALAVSLVGCIDDKTSPFSFKEFPGYTPPGAKAPADPHRTASGYAP